MTPVQIAELFNINYTIIYSISFCPSGVQGSSDTSVDRKIVVEGDESYKDRYSTINKDEEDTPRHLQQADAPQETSRGDAVARQYSEIGEDTNAVPDEDY